jgi:hypothetical protein
VADLMATAEAADQADVPDGMSIPEELARREQRLAAIARAKATIEARAKERQWNSVVGVWTRGILERRPVRLVTVALANKMARIAWALMTRQEVYRAKGRVAAATQAAA